MKNAIEMTKVDISTIFILSSRLSSSMKAIFLPLHPLGKGKVYLFHASKNPYSIRANKMTIYIQGFPQKRGNKELGSEE